MPVSVTMPRLGESVSEGTVTRWLKQVGDTITADEPLLEVSTDKVDTEIPAPTSGVLTQIKVQEDETVDVGVELAVIADAGEAAAPAAAAPAAAQPTPAQPTPAQPAPPPPPVPAAEAPSAPAPAPPAAAAEAPADAEGTAVVLPALGESVSEGTVTRWLKQVGDTITADEPLLEVSTDKVDTEIPAPTSGVLLAIRVNEDETVPVGTELAVIGAAGATPGHKVPGPYVGAPEQATPPAPQAPAQSAPVQPAPAPAPARPMPPPAPAPAPVLTTATVPAPSWAPAAAAASASAPAPETARETARETAPETAPVPTSINEYVTPLVRKLAAEHEVDLGTVTGTGIGGRIRKQDILDAARAKAEQRAAAAAAAQAQAATAAAPPIATPTTATPTSGAAAAVMPSPLRGRTEKLSRLRTVIANRMYESLQSTAQLTTVVEVDVTNIARLRTRAKLSFEAREGAKLSFLPFFALATVEALKAHPVLNAEIDVEAGTVTYHDAEHLAVAVDTERGLLVPVIHDAGTLNLGGLARRIADLAERTRSNKVSPDELVGGTFTLTNTGSRGALFDTPILNLPQVGILGTGAVVKRPIVIDDPELGEVIAVRSTVYLALTYDHRLVDGADAARFLTTVKARLEEGHFETDLGL